MPGWDGPLLASGHGVHRRVHRPAAESRTSPSPGRFRVRADRARAAELAAFYEFRDFPHFSQVYGAVSSLVREPADVAGRDHGVRMAYIFDIAGEYGGPAAFGTLEHALTCPPEALVGFELAGIEQARPRFAAEVRSVFASAGLHSVPHA